MSSLSISAEEILGTVLNVEREDGNGVVGSGGHTTVWRGIARIGSERSPMIVAVKEIKCFSGHDLQPNEKQWILRRLAIEVATWKTLQHRYILPFLGICYWNSNNANLPHLVSQWMQNGTSRDYLPSHHNVNPLEFLYRTAEGLQYLHKEGYSHGDIKGANILIGDDECPLLMDFGLSRLIQDIDSDSITQDVNSIHAQSWRWAAIEHFQDRPINRMAADIWSFGRLVLELWTNRDPFCDIPPSDDEERIRELVLANEEPLFATCYNRAYRRMNHEIENFCSDCWRFSPQDRLSMEEIVTFFRTKLTEMGVANQEPLNNSFENSFVNLFGPTTPDDGMPPLYPHISRSDSRIRNSGSQMPWDAFSNSDVLTSITNNDSSNRSASLYPASILDANLLASRISRPPSNTGQPGRSHDQSRRVSAPQPPPPPPSSPGRGTNYLWEFNEYLSVGIRLQDETDWVSINESTGNQPLWRVNLTIRGKICGTGTGHSIKEAKRRAAEYGGRVLGNSEVRRILMIKDDSVFERESYVISDCVLRALSPVTPES